MLLRRRKLHDHLTYLASAVGVVLVVVLSVQLIKFWTRDTDTLITVNKHEIAFSSRRLLGLSNCTPPAVEQFPRDYFTHDERRHGAIILHIILAAYMFLALALVCDDYFVPSCERICEVLKLQDDVAGATFVAAGSSAPELATAVIGVFIAKDDIGLGAVVGSAIFNIMFVISLCALFAGSIVYLKWWPLCRDCMFYTLSIILLVLAIMDEAIYWYESLVFLIMYGAYIVLMYFNRRIEAWIVPKFPSLSYRITPLIIEKNRANFGTIQDLEADELNANNNELGEIEELDMSSCGITPETESLLPANGASKNTHLAGILNSTSPSVGEGVTATEETIEVHVFEVDENCEKDDDGSSDDHPWVWQPPTSWCRRALWVVSWPLIAVMFLTIPDCRRPRWHKWFVVTFITSIAWIGAYSYFMVWMITIIGHTWSVPDSVMSLTLIAAGSSVPDAIASLLVVRDGYGDMAVSNAVGSNVFDILLCLGLPWFLQTTIVNPFEPVQVYSAGLTYSSLTLLTTVVLLLVMTHLNKWRLTRPYGALLMIIYVAFNILSSLYELNIFAYVHPPECPSPF